MQSRPYIHSLGLACIAALLAGCHSPVPAGGAPPEDAPRIVGHYYRGDGLAFNNSLQLRQDGTFKFGSAN